MSRDESASCFAVRMNSSIRPVSRQARPYTAPNQNRMWDAWNDVVARRSACSATVASSSTWPSAPMAMINASEAIIAWKPGSSGKANAALAFSTAGLAARRRRVDAGLHRQALRLLRRGLGRGRQAVEYRRGLGEASRAFQIRLAARTVAQ